jgi:hypothetical protein
MPKKKLFRLTLIWNELAWPRPLSGWMYGAEFLESLLDFFPGSVCSTPTTKSTYIMTSAMFP